MPLPTIAGPGVGLPVFLRKIRRSDWGAEGDAKGAMVVAAAMREQCRSVRGVMIPCLVVQCPFGQDSTEVTPERTRTSSAI